MQRRSLRRVGNDCLPYAKAAGDTASTPISHVVIIIRTAVWMISRNVPRGQRHDGRFTPGRCRRRSQARVRQRASPLSPTRPAFRSPMFTAPGSVSNGGADRRSVRWDNDLAHNYADGYLMECDSAGGARAVRRLAGSIDSTSPSSVPTAKARKRRAPTPINTSIQTTSNRTGTWPSSTCLPTTPSQTQGSESFTAHQALITQRCRNKFDRRA